ncbi:poly(A)-specific ribonuclease [Linnemannia elongata]|nr:poly(A)-specific ribonuclease [Linnemannia elongata]
MSLARVSVLRGDEGPLEYVPFIDDYIATSEPVVDYLTEYSGIQPGDLDPGLSKHTLVPLKVAYKRLRVLVDMGCIFVGHGLRQDFRIINILVPPEQVKDTVDIFHIKNRQRKISLRFLVWYLLHQDIQSETHNSTEDARTALALYKKYLELKENGLFQEVLEDIYNEGRKNNWKPIPGQFPPPWPRTSTPVMVNNGPGGGAIFQTLSRPATPATPGTPSASVGSVPAVMGPSSTGGIVGVGAANASGGGIVMTAPASLQSPLGMSVHQQQLQKQQMHHHQQQQMFLQQQQQQQQWSQQQQQQQQQQHGYAYPMGGQPPQQQQPPPHISSAGRPNFRVQEKQLDILP